MTALLSPRHVRLVLAACVAILGVRLILALTVIPPWQSPDEQAHVAVSELWRHRWLGAEVADPGREGEIIASMIEHDWWRHYDRVPPSRPLPDRFAAVGAAAPEIGISPAAPGYLPGYYGAMGWLLSVLPRGTVEFDLYLMRGLAALLAVALLWTAWHGTRAAMGDSTAVVVAALVALHPRFVAAATTAGPDGVINLAGALVWWMTMLALRQPRAWHFAVMWIAAIYAAQCDRMGLPLVALAMIMSLAVGVSRRVLGFGAGVVTGLLVGAAVALLPSARELTTLREAVWAVRGYLGESEMVVDYAESWDYFRRFTSFLFESWWFTVGWVRYQAPGWWVMAAGVLSSVAALGVIGRMVRPRREHVRLIIVLAIVAIVAYVAAVYLVFFRAGVGAQGRHFLPVFVPSIALLVLGFEACCPAKYWNRVAAGLILAVFLLDGLAWVLVTLPAYAS